jgi:hypothetical protein
VTRVAVPSTITSRPASIRSVPVVSTQRGSRARFRAFCSWSPVQMCRAPSAQIAGIGVTCGLPSPRTVDSQNIVAPVSTRSTSDQDVAAASGELNAALSSPIGSGVAIDAW